MHRIHNELKKQTDKKKQDRNYKIWCIISAEPIPEKESIRCWIAHHHLAEKRTGRSRISSRKELGTRRALWSQDLTVYKTKRHRN